MLYSSWLECVRGCGRCYSICDVIFTGFKVDNHERTLADVISRHANPPLELPAEPSAVRKAIDQYTPDP